MIIRKSAVQLAPGDCVDRQLFRLKRCYAGSRYVSLTLSDRSGQIEGQMDVGSLPPDWGALLGFPVLVNGLASIRNGKAFLLVSSLVKGEDPEGTLDPSIEKEEAQTYARTIYRMIDSLSPPLARVMEDIYTDPLIQGLTRLPFFEGFSFAGGALAGTATLAATALSVAQVLDRYGHGLYHEQADRDMLIVSVLLLASAIPQLYQDVDRNPTDKVKWFGPHDTMMKHVWDQMARQMPYVIPRETGNLLIRTVKEIRGTARPVTLEGVIVQQAYQMVTKAEECEKLLSEERALQGTGGFRVSEGSVCYLPDRLYEGKGGLS